jgi:NAD(P)-dependent dehydrogenase (short-subunit alcohol dehydrogenase family)
MPNVDRMPVPRTSLVTGGTGGIGRAVALRLARGGDRVLIVGRDPRRGAEVLALLRDAAPGPDHRFLPADLSLLSDTARLVEHVERTTDGLDATVCCAGVLATVPLATTEGLERAFVLNYLSRYLLARRLLPALTASPSGRLVLVANAGRYRDTLDLDDLQHRRGRPGLAVAGRTQFANDLLAVELAERVADTRVQVTCVDPGMARTDVFRNAQGPGPLLRGLSLVLQRLVAANPDDAAATPAWLAQDPAATAAGGRFWARGPREKRIPERVRRPDRRAGLWAASEALVAGHLPSASATPDS